MKKFIFVTFVVILFFQHIACSEPSKTGTLTERNIGGSVSGRGAYEKAVIESARDIPVAYDVDVVVVGGSTGAVTAAVAAAEKGAKVFLATSQPYLGEDICGTYRLWLEPGREPKSPLAKKIFAEPSVPPRVRKGLSFKYQADKPSAAMHKDTPNPSLLNDGKWHSASTQSVQYDGDVSITCDLGKECRLQKVHVMVYQRRNRNMGNDFEVQSVIVSVGNDNQNFKQVADLKNKRASEALKEPWGPIDLSSLLTEQARYVKLQVKKSSDVNRILLGEIIFESEQAGDEPPSKGRIPPTPMQVKQALDDALLEAGVQFLYGCYATDVLRDGKGVPAGIVMANRSGRQAVKAKVIIDATPRAAVARMAGASFRPYPAGNQTFKYIAVGGKVRTGEGIRVRKMPTLIPAGNGPPREAVEYTLSIPMKDSSFASFAEAEQIARDRTWSTAQVDATELLFQVPPDPMRAESSLSGDWPGAEKVNLNVFRPKGIKHLYVLGGCADVSRSTAEKLLRPLELMKVGSRLGRAAASQAKRRGKLKGVKLYGRAAKPVKAGDTREDLSWIGRGLKKSVMIHAEKRPLPVVGQYDVVVIGGGTGGAPAGIAAARQGGKTLVIEYLHGLGGVGTVGLISSYYHGNRVGFTTEVDRGIAGFTGDENKLSSRWNPEWKKEWYRQQMRKAGADIWFGTLGCGAFVERRQTKRVTGVVVATPEGRGVVLAKVIIDSTGNADIAAAAGAECVYTNGSGVAVQGAGLPPRNMGTGYTNTDWTFIDDGDVIDTWRAYVVAKKKYSAAYDLGQLIDTRERRRIVGDFIMSPLDILNDRTYPDTIVVSKSDFDSHGFTVHPAFLLKPPGRKDIYVNVPYRCLLPEGFDGILVTGLGVSAHRDAMPVIRMQADIQNQGYAVGVIGAMAAKSGGPLRDIDIKALQKHLIEKGNLPERVLTDKDSFPLPQEEIDYAVERVANDFDGLEVVLTQPHYTMPLLRQAYKTAETTKAKLAYAHIVGMLGDPTGAQTLVHAVESTDWDKGWNFKGMGQYGSSISALDSVIIALGRTRDKRGLGPILHKVGQLDSDSEFSHCRAIGMALEILGDSAAAEPLATLLQKPGVMGHAFTEIEDAKQRTPPNSSDNTTRNLSLRELYLARALYRCGDYKGIGEKILTEYARDLRGHYAHHAQTVLKMKK
ncbi:MAG: FAD-dependent oxidoreductase [Phycisphaerae bacterium]|nr:FAD-dependent oxidoreductase [Phycisphaerae bacterium]NIP50727.1 FAD-dependent oxidoreductase [Phycisphaerae bacterium]NIX26489.1 FAD-dependent oxidoreductase [Phycisphaerae bacterium]